MKLRDLLTETPLPAERTTIKTTAWKGPKEIADWLKERRFKKIGGGAYSVAYARARSDKIVKLSRHEDQCWMRFAKFVKSKRSQHLPKIYDIVEYEARSGKKLFVTVMEKLKPVKLDIVDWTRQNRRALAWMISNSVLYNVRSRADMNKISEILGFEYEKSVDFDEKIHKIARKFERSNGSFANLYRELKRKVGKKCFIDIHDGNVFYRPSTKTLVFLDPYA